MAKTKARGGKSSAPRDTSAHSTGTIRTVVGTRLEALTLPFPIEGYHVYDARYEERPAHEADAGVKPPQDITVAHALLLSDRGGAVRLHVTAVGRDDRLQVTAGVGVVLAFTRPADRSEQELVQVLSTVGVNAAFSLLRAELMTLTRSGAMGPLHLDPALFVVQTGPAVGTAVEQREQGEEGGR